MLILILMVPIAKSPPDVLDSFLGHARVDVRLMGNVVVHAYGDETRARLVGVPRGDEQAAPACEAFLRHRLPRARHPRLVAAPLRLARSARGLGPVRFILRAPKSCFVTIRVLRVVFDTANTSEDFFLSLTIP